MVSAAGVRLDFLTDAKSFTLSGRAEAGSSRNFYWFDIAVNGILVRHEGSESRADEPDFSYEIGLDGGMNRVTVYFPGLSEVVLKGLDFSGETVVRPVSRKCVMICYGDSITQGYDARYASLAYPNQLADALDAEMFNKAIGGEIFNPALASLPDPVHPDFITVAYGTNDWSKCSSDVFQNNLDGFFYNLTKTYPDVPIFALLPLWRIGCETRETQVGTFAGLRSRMVKTCSEYRQVRVLDGLKLVPHLKSCFSPDVLHPNDFGFQFMAKNILNAVIHDKNGYFLRPRPAAAENARS